MRILLGSGFFESDLPSFREYSYSKELAALGHEVTLLCGDQSYVWKRSRVRLPETLPGRNDAEFAAATGVRVLRRRVFFRVSDFVLYWPAIGEIRRADVVHVIEFRQGITVAIALLARLFGKPVVYDHEQRGDRTEKWYSRVDSVFRRMLIFVGSLTVSCVRHTVLANRDHFLSCTPRRVPAIFAPLGVDPQRFYFDAAARTRVRAELALGPNDGVAVMSGKLHKLKRVFDVAKACRDAEVKLVLIGTISPDVAAQLATLEPGTVIALPQAKPERLRDIYNACDFAIFTTFSVSYWEAHATGIHLILPGTAFTARVFSTDPHVTTFGDQSLFRIADEEYREGIDITEAVTQALRVQPLPDRRSRLRFSARDQCQNLATLYAQLVGSGGGVARNLPGS
jgi:glycosyltransferase involved in cell wall biosynthesis